ncbi:hypothetical protein AGMMS49975_28450 [Clostridia bacterium]|nr:hypothetical protein AGMMS49975_28450 [Clostridia bacterium]
MKIDIDCVKDLLTVLQEHPDTSEICLTQICDNPRMAIYQRETIYYNTQRLADDAYIEVEFKAYLRLKEVYYKRLTTKGDELLARLNSQPQPIIEKLRKIENITLAALPEIIASLLGKMIGV